jgi:phosphohistidine swiveling domain-containing protein
VLTSPDDGSERIRGAIPPVTGTKIGTQVIADGQTITLDGDAGEVLIG